MYISVKAFENADRDSAVKANVNLTIDNAFVVKNLTIVQGRNGMFLNMPHHKSNEVGADGKAVYKDDAFPLSKNLRDKMQEAAIESYERGGEEGHFEYGGREKTSPEKEGARRDKPSILKILQEKVEIFRISLEIGIHVTYQFRLRIIETGFQGGAQSGIPAIGDIVEIRIHGTGGFDAFEAAVH